jgi:5'-phosphate synthase pdxT subunit
MNEIQKTIGVFALQGDFEAHGKVFSERLGVPTRQVRSVKDLEQADALVLPGGESTTFAKLMARFGLDSAIRARAETGMPLFGTCAGMILLAKRIEGREDQPTLGLMDITVARNAFGRQLDSFEADIPFDFGAEAPQTVHGVFIRAPYVTEAAPNVQVLARYEDHVVGVRQGSCLAIAFHPELTDDTRVHSYFLKMVAESRETRS